MSGFIAKTGTAKIAASVATVASTCGILIEFLPHTFYLDKYKSFLTRSRYRKEVPLPDKIHQLFEAVLNDLEISKSTKQALSPFAVAGFNLFHAGITNKRAIIGIPINFTYESKSSVNESDLRIGIDQEPINMHHPAAEDLVNSLVLSTDAKKFGIAREILMADKNLPLYKSVETMILISGTAIMADVHCSRFNLKRKFSIVMVCGGTALFGFIIWCQVRDALTKYFEKEVDDQLSKLGPQYIEGGKEFYDKLLKRNVAMRTLAGKQGTKQFNRDGDERYFFRLKRTPISHRKRFFEQLQLENLQNERTPA